MYFTCFYGFLEKLRFKSCQSEECLMNVEGCKELASRQRLLICDGFTLLTTIPLRCHLLRKEIGDQVGNMFLVLCDFFLDFVEKL